MRQEFDGFYMTDDRDQILGKYEEISALLRQAYWAKDREASVMREAMENSLNYAIFEKDSERLVGYARVVTDFATVFYLCDVFVEEEFRGKGFGKKLLEWILIHEERIKDVKGLLKTGKAKELYEKYGFEICKSICMVLDRE